jgi:hypothetical protein
MGGKEHITTNIIPTSVHIIFNLCNGLFLCPNLSQPRFFPITSFFYTDSGKGDHDPDPLKSTPPIFEKLYRGSLKWN